MKYLAFVIPLFFPSILLAELECSERDLSGLYGIPQAGERLVLKEQINEFPKAEEDKFRYISVKKIEYGEAPCKDEDAEVTEETKSICTKIIELSIYNPPKHVFIKAGQEIEIGRLQNKQHFFNSLKSKKSGDEGLSESMKLKKYGSIRITCSDAISADNGQSSIDRECRDEDFEQFFTNKSLEKCQQRARRNSSSKNSGANEGIR